MLFSFGVWNSLAVIIIVMTVYISVYYCYIHMGTVIVQSIQCRQKLVFVICFCFEYKEMAYTTWILFSDLKQPFLLYTFLKSWLFFWVFCSRLPDKFSESVFSSEGYENAPLMGLVRAVLASKMRPLTVTAGWHDSTGNPGAGRPRATQNSSCRGEKIGLPAWSFLFHFLIGGFSSLICFYLVVYYFIFLGGWNQHVWALIMKRPFICMDWLQWTSLASVWDNQGYTLVLWKNGWIQNYQGLVIFIIYSLRMPCVILKYNTNNQKIWP